MIIVPKVMSGPSSLTVVLFHGYGSCGANMADLARMWSMPDVTFICPDGPAVCPEYPSGRQWFSLQGMDWNRPDLHGAWKGIGTSLSLAAEQFCSTLETIAHQAGGNVVVAGFSQGAMMAYELGLFAFPVKGIIGMSGAYALGKDPKYRPPVFWTHAEDDHVVPCSWMQESERGLQNHGVPTHHHISIYGGHSVSQDSIRAIAAFLRSITPT